MKQHDVLDSPVIDFGAHVYGRRFDEPGEEGLSGYIDPDRRYDVEAIIAEYQNAGVDAIVSSNPYYMNHDDFDEILEANDMLNKYIESYDEFYGLATIPMGAVDGEQAANEFERCLNNGFNGGALAETNVGLTDKEMQPVLEVADSTEAPIFVHIPDLSIVEYRFNATFGRERLQQESISRVIHDGIYDRYDNLRIVWHHLGGNIAAMMGRIHLQTDPGRWPQPDMKSFGEYKADFETRVYVDTAGYFGYSAPIRIALEEFPSTQVLFGTDWAGEPRSGEELACFVESIRESGTKTDVKRILGQNALDLMVNVQ